MQEWLELEVGKVEQSYVAKILNMTAAYRRETSHSKGYNGRQLLELLQNANEFQHQLLHAQIDTKEK